MTSNHIAWYNMMETKRHNEALEMLNLGSLQETRRHNVATEAETHRSNVVYEGVALRNATVNERNATVNERNAAVNERNAAVNEMNAATNRQLAEIRAQELAESITHNRAMEAAKSSELAISRAQLHRQLKDTASQMDLRQSQIDLNRSATQLNNARSDETAANTDLKGSQIALNEVELQYADTYYKRRNTGQLVDNIFTGVRAAHEGVKTVSEAIYLGDQIKGHLSPVPDWIMPE
jgi:hypothetical protein